MNFNNQPYAKRRYKQALLSTLATMTLGVNTLGSTIPAFAEENKASTQQASSISTTDGPVFKRESNGVITVLKDKLFNKETLKAIGSLSGATLKQAWADSKVDGGNFNNTFRTFTMGSAALIPYGGVVISPLIGLLWPEDTTDAKNRLENLMKDTAKQTHAQIESYDLETLGQKLEKLYKDLKEFEEIMNPNGRKIASAPSVGTKEDVIRSKAASIHSNFKDLISESQKPSYKEAELPIFMVVATAHLNFLHYMELHGKDPKINYNDEGLKLAFLNSQKQARKDYLDYATSFAKKDLDSADQLVQSIPEQLYTISISDCWGADTLTQTMNFAIQGMSGKLENTLNNTINNMAFKQALGIQSEWTMDQNGRTFYYDLKGQMQTKWKEISTSFATRYNQGPNGTMEPGNPLKHESLKKLLTYSWYYFSPEKTDKFEKGEMYRDTTQTINGTTYKFDSNGKCLNPDGEQPIAISEGNYKIVSALDSNKVLDFNYGSKSNGGTVLYQFHTDDKTYDHNSQRWELKYDKDKQAYQIISKRDSSKIVAFDRSDDRAGFVFVTKNKKKDEHYWVLEDAGNGYFFIKNYAKPDMMLNVDNNNSSNNTPIHVHTKNNNIEQKFKFVGY